MTVMAVEKNQEELTMTVRTEFDATPERIWQLWEDPRQLERWWGPPTYPATFTQHDLTPGARVKYHMTGPEGDQPKAWWDIVSVDPPNGLVLRDGMADDNGDPNPDFPVSTVRIAILPLGAGKTQMSIKTEFASLEAMELYLSMGMEEGLTGALGQIDEILAEGVPA